MDTRKREDAVFTTCASCAVLAAGAAFAALLYHLFTLTVSLVESAMWSANVAMRGM